MSFGPDKGEKRVFGLRAERHCEVRLDGEVVGLLLSGGGGCEYRGKPVGRRGLEWVVGADSRDVVGKLRASLEQDG